MQGFYRNSSPFLYNNFYRNNFVTRNYSTFSSSPSNSRIFNCNNFPKNTLNKENTSDKTSNNSSEIFHNSIEQNLPPNKDFVLDLFGIKLYFDDILILSLLFFLYKENVKDDWLFLSLVLLLIS